MPLFGFICLYVFLWFSMLIPMCTVYAACGGGYKPYFIWDQPALNKLFVAGFSSLLVDVRFCAICLRYGFKRNKYFRFSLCLDVSSSRMAMRFSTFRAELYLCESNILLGMPRRIRQNFCSLKKTTQDSKNCNSRIFESFDKYQIGHRDAIKASNSLYVSFI